MNSHLAFKNFYKRYLKIEWMRKFPEKKDSNPIEKLNGAIVESPHQTHAYDCGIYFLQNVESFFTVIFF